MLPYWAQFDNIIAKSQKNFLTLCNYEMMARIIYLFRYSHLYDILYDRYFPKEYEEWFSTRSIDAYRLVFGLDEEICSAKISELSGRPLPRGGVYFWGPRRNLLAYAAWRPGAAIPGTWFDQYLIPQNELRLLQDGSDETFHYDETLHIIKVIDNSGNEIA
jgi:hypothetical protein